MLSNDGEFCGAHVAGDVGASGSDGEAPTFYTFIMVEAALVEAHDLWRRSPRVGHRALKSCWPNEMLQRIDAGDLDARGGDMVAPALRPLPLSRAEVAVRDRVSAWVEYVPSEINRRIVLRATAQLAGGRSQICWRAVRRQLRLDRGRGFEGRYRRAIGAICAALNYPDVVAMVRSGDGPKAIAAACGLTFGEACRISQQLKAG